MYRISDFGWPDIRPFLNIWFRPKWHQVLDISTG